MTTHISTKLAALSVALMINGAMMGSVAFLFSGPLQHDKTSSPLSQGTATPQVLI